MWEERWSKSRNIPYYYNLTTGESVWERPTSNQTKQEKVRVKHILIKHSGSRNPISWRSPNESSTIDKAKAIREMTGYMRVLF